MTNMSGDMPETSVTDFFTVTKLHWFHQCLDPTKRQKRSGPDPWTGWKLTTTGGIGYLQLPITSLSMGLSDIVFEINGDFGV